MTSMRRRRSSSRSRAPRRRTLWWNVATVPLSVTGGVIANLTMAGFTIPAFPSILRNGFKSIRMLLEVELHLNSPISTDAYGAFAAYVGDENIGVVSPVADLYDYYVHQNWSANNDGQSKYYNYDIRTARNVRGEQRNLRFSFENVGIDNVTMRVATRLLLSPL